MEASNGKPGVYVPPHKRLQKSCLMACTKKPSEVKDTSFMSYPPHRNVIESDDEWERCGKWILESADRSLSFVDKAWIELRPLLKDGIIIMLKVSTALMESEGAVVLCYTSPGKEEIKRAAEGIRNVIDFNSIMYYKVNKMTEDGIARRSGHKLFTKYMYTFKRRFYVRDGIQRWILDDEGSHFQKTLPENYCNLGLEDLPSKSSRIFLDIKHSSESDSEREYNRNWFFWCNCSEEEDATLAEVDRIWIVAKKLLDEGVFTRITCCTLKRPSVEIRCFVSDDADPYSMLKYCDTLFSYFSSSSLMFFKSSSVSCELKYTAEGELYDGNLVGKFILSTKF